MYATFLHTAYFSSWIDLDFNLIPRRSEMSILDFPFFNSHLRSQIPKTVRKFFYYSNFRRKSRLPDMELPCSPAGWGMKLKCKIDKEHARLPPFSQRCKLKSDVKSVKSTNSTRSIHQSDGTFFPFIVCKPIPRTITPVDNFNSLIASRTPRRQRLRIPHFRFEVARWLIRDTGFDHDSPAALRATPQLSPPVPPRRLSAVA